MIKNLFFSISCFVLLSILFVSCKKEKPSDSTPITLEPIKLGAPIKESKVYQLFSGYTDNDVFEASGIKYVGDHFYVVFDNTYKVASVQQSLIANGVANFLSTGSSNSSNYEGIAYDYDGSPNIYVLAENQSHNGQYSPRIYNYDVSLHKRDSAWAPYSYTSTYKNKGFEGLTFYHRNNKDYLLGLSEASGDIIVMEANGSEWIYISTIRFPQNKAMNDYSDIDISSSGAIAVTSQESSLLWIGKLSDTNWQLDGEGTLYAFPTGDENGNVGNGSNVLYGNVEGVSFMTDKQVVICSDKTSSNQPAYQDFKAQTISIFNIPK
ncbi:MAG: hypothetical protein WCP57_11835 [Bacteroidota bacterium]